MECSGCVCVLTISHQQLIIKELKDKTKKNILKGRKEVKLELVFLLSFLAHSTAFRVAVTVVES